MTANEIIITADTLGRAVRQVAKQIAQANPKRQARGLQDEVREGVAVLAEAGHKVTMKALTEVLQQEIDTRLKRSLELGERRRARNAAIAAAAQAVLNGADMDAEVSRANGVEGVTQRITAANVRGRIVQLNKRAAQLEKRERTLERVTRKVAKLLQKKKNQVIVRGSDYGNVRSVGPVDAAWLERVPFRSVLPKGYVENISNRYSRFRNVDLYDVAPDLQAVLYQVRDTEHDNKKNWNSTKKTYLLATRSGDGSWDEVEVSGHAVQAARKKEGAARPGYIIEQMKEKLEQAA